MCSIEAFKWKSKWIIIEMQEKDETYDRKVIGIFWKGQQKVDGSECILTKRSEISRNLKGSTLSRIADKR